MAWSSRSEEPLGAPRTLGEVLTARSQSPNDCLIFPTDPVHGDDARRYSFAEVFVRARRIAEGLTAAGASGGDRVAIVGGNDIEFIALFLGAVLSDLVPVPLAPPLFAARFCDYVARLRAQVLDSGARLLATTSGVDVAGGSEAIDFPCPIATHDEIAARATPANRRVPVADAGDVALIQYSSGSTRTPRGAMLTHDNLLQNVRGIGAGVKNTKQDVVLCWLPLFHDMGLIGSFLYAYYWGFPLVLMSPAEVVFNPASWLWAVSRFGVVGCAAPNFAYSLCASRKKVPDHSLRGLDLTSWRDALNGAEAVQQATIDAFSERFRPYGFSGESMLPVYGLSENTVAACFPRRGRLPRVDRVDRRALEEGTFARTGAREAPDEDARCLVSVGEALPGQEMRIVTATGPTTEDRRIGEIELRGACVMQGYVNRPDETRCVISRDGWLKTGDLGYLLEGELYVVGRMKEIIKKAGASYDASDIQFVVGSVPGVRKGCVAAFSTANERTGTEDLVVVAETARSVDDSGAVEASIRREIARVFSVRPDVVRLIAPGMLPKSTSGKVRGLECRKQYVKGEFERASQS